jgi:hypothetical protein
MNGQDKKDLSVILERMEQHEVRQKEMRDDIKFIKENLFNPHDGLWTETKQNTQFRENTTKWRSVMGVGFVGLMAERVYNFIIGS